MSRDGYEFAGWGYNGKVYQPGVAFTMPNANVTFTAQWVQSYGIVGSVVWEEDPPQDDPKPAQDILVELKRGNECLADTTTNADGRFSFDHILPGVYNLVISSGNVTRTAMVELVNQDEELPPIQLPQGKTNSILEVKDGAPSVVVGNLDNLFTASSEEDNTEYAQVYTQEDRELVKNGGKVEIRMEVVIAVLLVVFGKRKGKVPLTAILCAVGTVIVALFTTGWNGMAFATIWTLPVAVLTLLSGWFSLRKGEEKVNEN